MATASLELDLPSCVGDRGTLRATRHDACDGGVAVVRPVIVSRDPSVVQVVDGAIVATGPGRTTLVVSVDGVIGDQQVDVVVQSCSETGGEVGAGDAADGSPG